MMRVNQTILLPICLTAWLMPAAPIPADPPESPVGYAVAVSDSATPWERRAGELLEESGIGVRVSGIGRQEGRTTIYVGVSLASMTLGRARTTPVDWASLGGDGVAIFKADNGDIVIAGGRASGGRGTVHAAVRFLEDRAGCRWWPDGTALIPTQTVPRPGGRGLGDKSDEPYELIGGPAFGGDSGGTSGGAAMWPAAWALGESGFGREQVLGGAYYVATAAGKLESAPTHADGSVCLSDGVLREAVIAAVRQDLEGAYPRVKRVEMGIRGQGSGIGDQGEEAGQHCAKCEGLIEKTGSPAGVLLDFGNAVAKAVAEDYPEARIVLTFEGRNAKPASGPGVRAEQNVVIRWVHDPYREGVAGEHRAAGWPFLGELRAWAAVGGTLELVEPLVDTRDYLAPQGGLYDLGLRLRQAKAFGVKSVDFLGAPNCGAADWLDMRKWVAGHLAWDPTRDVRGRRGCVHFLVARPSRASERGVSPFQGQLIKCKLPACTKSPAHPAMPWSTRRSSGSARWRPVSPAGTGT